MENKIKINTYAQKEIESLLIKKQKTVLISILDNSGIPLSKRIDKYYCSILELVFDDITLDFNKLNDNELNQKEKIELGKMKIFDINHYNRIKDFVTVYKDYNIDVHCSAGVSRSTAVAIGISFIKNDLELMKDTIMCNNIKLPNDYVLAKMFVNSNAHNNGLNLRNAYKLCDNNLQKFKY